MKKPSLETQCRDTGLALAFLALLLWLFSPHRFFIYIAMIVLLATMISPALMTYPAKMWFGLSHLLGLVMGKVILGLLFFLIVLPVSLVRKMMGKDAMRFKLWKNGTDSAFVNRDHTFTKNDLDNAF